MTLIVNLFGQPCSGKSVSRATLFTNLKIMGVECEEVTEVAKDFVWEERYFALSSQIYVYAKQRRNIERVANKVDVVITDSPVLLSCFYGRRYNANISDHFYLGIIEDFKKMNNLNIFITPVGEYNPIGRMQSAEEAAQIGADMQSMLTSCDIPFVAVRADDYSTMCAAILERTGQGS